MNTKLTLLLLAVIATCAFAMQWLANDSYPTRPAPERAAPLQPMPSDVASTGVGKPSPQIVAIEAATETVLGIEVRKDRNCVVRRHYLDLGNGTVTDAYSCVPASPDVDDYEHYSDEQLRVLSYSDAKAASILGKRLVEVDLAEAEALLLRAIALQPANLDPVMWLAAQAHSLRGDTRAAHVARANTYVLTRVAQELGSTAGIEWILADLEQAGFTPDDVRRLDERVRERLRQIRDIQLEVFGDSIVEEVQL